MGLQRDIEGQIRAKLALYLKREPETVHLEHSLRDDLGLDSIAIIELLYRIEEAFDLQIPDEHLPQLQTVGAVTAYVEERLRPTRAASTAKPQRTRRAGKKKG